MASTPEPVFILDEQDEKLRLYLERVSLHSTDPQLHNSSQGNTFTSLENQSQENVPAKSTNPFLSPSAGETDNIDVQNFFEEILSRGMMDQCEESPSQPTVASTNPFLNEHLESLASQSIQPVTEKVNYAGRSASDLLLKDTNQTIQPVPEVGTNNQPRCSSSRLSLEGTLTVEEFLNDSSSMDNECSIRNYFDHRSWKLREFIPLRISNIYSPSRFWIVPRYKELEIFMEYLCGYYSKNKDNCRLDQVSANQYCAVSANGLYYRAIVISYIPNDPHKIKVFLFDYGSIMTVFKDEVYRLEEKLYHIPQFAVRASLAYICPRDHQTWQPEHVKYFEDYSLNKVLVGQIVDIDVETKCLQMIIGEAPSDGYTVVYINELLQDEGFAKHIFDEREPEVVDFQSKVKYLYLFPTFEEIETGKVLSSVYNFQALKGELPFDVIYKRYLGIL